MRKSDFTLPTLDDLFSTQAERDDAKLERVRNIPLAELHPFKGHPFKVQNNEEMQQMIDSRPFIEEKIIKQQSELKELSKGYYDLMENQQVDELVTGIILKHNLFPVNLSISETTPGIPMSYILASAKASETHVLTAEEELNGETEAETDGDGTDSGFYAAPQFDYTNTTMVSVTVQGSESEIKSFLDDLARNYPGIQARSFELSNTIYVSENLKSVQSMNCRCDLAVYTCGEIGGESLIEDES